MAEIDQAAEPDGIAHASINHAIFCKAIRSVTLKFENVEFIIKKKREGMLKQMKKKEEEKTEDKVILKGIDGIVFPGEMLAMLGPSGSGKTTLLTALGGRLSGSLTGDITYNGKPFSNVVKRNIGFVTQDDVFYPHLTVTESLVFTALLRLPNSLTKNEKILHVDDVIAQLGLTKCKDSIIGGTRVRGVSGGEKKRVSIGQEMLINPSLLLLDEPTSGLDSTTAQRIVSTIRELANGGRTIVMTIHQPSSRLYYMFHKVLLLSEGNQLYFGNTNDAMNYFAAIGFVPLFTMNPADFLLDLANGISPDNSQEDQALVKQTLVKSYETNLSTKVKAELQQQQPNHDNLQVVSNDKQSTKWNTTWWQQFSVLLRRGLKERKHESFSGLNIGQVLTVSLLAGLLWWRSDISHLQDQIGLFYFYTGFWGFYILLGAIFTFPSERAMLEKERASGMYRLSSYFLARTIGDLPLLLILPIVFVTITYWMAGLKAAAENYVLTVLTVLLSVVVTEGMGLAIGAICMDLKKASTLGSVIMLSFLLAGGFYVQNIPKFMSWIKYISIANHSYRLLLLSQYKNGETYQCGSNKICLVDDYPFIKSIGLNGATMSVTALFIMLVFYRLVAYAALMRTGVTRK